jgi:hypothetical protein
MPADVESCTCFEPESFRDDFQRTVLGVDAKEGRFGEVSLDRCRQCGRVWLHYFLEYPEVPESGRYFRGLLTPEAEGTVTPGDAVRLLEALPWRLQGGAFFGRRGARASGPLPLEP